MLRLCKIQKSLIHQIVSFLIIGFQLIILIQLFCILCSQKTEDSKEQIICTIFDKTDDLNVVDYSSLENENIFLEGTGSLVLDRKIKSILLII